MITRFETLQNNVLPPIAIPASDYPRLSRLVDAAGPELVQVSDYLSRELQRAQIIEDAAFDAQVVRIGSLVSYREGVDGRSRTIRLVWPHEADVNRSRVSVMSAVGAALVGMARGQTIAWPSPVGGTRTLTVLAIHGGDGGGDDETPDAAA